MERNLARGVGSLSARPLGVGTRNMNRRFVLAALVLGLGTSAARGQLAIDRQMIPTRTALEKVGLEKHWTGFVPLATGPERLLRISIAADTPVEEADKWLLFAQTDHSNFHVFQAETGRYLWGLNLGDEMLATAFPASVNSKYVFVTSNMHLFCLDRPTGRIVWKAKLEKIATSPTAADEERAMVGLMGGKVVCYSALDHSKDPKAGLSAGTFLWAWKTNGAVTGRPIPANKLVAMGSQDHRAYVALIERDILQPAVLLFRYLTEGPISASMAPYGDRTLLIPSEDGNLYAVDLFTAETKWTFSSGNPIEYEPLVASNEIFVLNRDGQLTSIDGAKSGRGGASINWSVNAGQGRFLGLSENRIYAMSRSNDLVVADRATGQILLDPKATYGRAGLNLRAFSMHWVNFQTDRLYLAMPSGMLMCLRQSGHLQPTLLRPHTDRPFGYIPDSKDEPDGGLVPPTPGETPAGDVVPTEPPAGDVPPAEPAPGGELPGDPPSA
jgi:outer membrane protein assembly factor BamB